MIADDAQHSEKRRGTLNRLSRLVIFRPGFGLTLGGSGFQRSRAGPKAKAAQSYGLSLAQAAASSKFWPKALSDIVLMAKETKEAESEDQTNIMVYVCSMLCTCCSARLILTSDLPSAA